MIESGYFTLSKSKVLRWLSWAAVVGFLVSAWGAELGFHKHMLAVLLGLTACILPAYAAVRHMRCYMIRLATLIRFAHDLNPQDVEDHMPGIRKLPPVDRR